MVEDTDCEDDVWGYCKTGEASGCNDVPRGWQDKEGDGCSTYAQEGWCLATGGVGPNWESEWGSFDQFANADGATASTACCRCGGGSTRVNAASCTDVPNWKDSDQENCQTYQDSFWCTSNGGFGPGWHVEEWGAFPSGTQGAKATEACCACGGGNKASSQPGASLQAAPGSENQAAPTLNEVASGGGLKAMIFLVLAVGGGLAGGLYCYRQQQAKAGQNSPATTAYGKKYSSVEDL